MIDIDDLKARNNIVDVISGQITLKKAGKNYQACCPFHTEKTPSFTVDEAKQFYHCFGCGAHGDVVSFVQEYFNVDFVDAAKILGGEHKDEDLIKYSASQRQPKIRLPLNQQPHDQDEIFKFITEKCEEMHGTYFYGDYQAVRLTDINKNVVSCVLIRGNGFENKYFKKEFLYGSCVVFGEITDGEDVFLCETFQQALSMRLITEKAVICFFEPLNLSFITQDLKRKTNSIIVIAISEETISQADSLNLINCYMKYYNENYKVDFKCMN